MLICPIMRNTWLQILLGSYFPRYILRLLCDNKAAANQVYALLCLKNTWLLFYQ